MFPDDFPLVFRHAIMICAAGIVLLCSFGAAGSRDVSKYTSQVPIDHKRVQKVIDQILENGFDPRKDAASVHRGSYKNVYQLHVNTDVAMLTVQYDGIGKFAREFQEEIDMLFDLEDKGARVPQIYGQYHTGAGPKECAECKNIYMVTFKGGEKRWAFFMEYIQSDMTLAQGKVCFPYGDIRKGIAAFKNLGAEQKMVAKQDLLRLRELFKKLFIMDGQLMCEKSTGHVYVSDPLAVYSMEDWLNLAQKPQPKGIKLISRWRAARAGHRCGVENFLQALE